MYTLRWKNPSIEGKTQAIDVRPGEVLSPGAADRQTASLTFTGKGTANYGRIQQENLMRLLENFADTIPPVSPTIGQLWFDTTKRTLKVCSTVTPTVSWRNIGGVQTSEGPPTSPSLGDMWSESQVNSPSNPYPGSTGTLYVYTGFGPYPRGNTLGGWDQIWPGIETVAGREEYDYVASLVNQLIGPVESGGSGALGTAVPELPNLAVLDADLRAKYLAQTPLDANRLFPTNESPNQLKVDVSSQDWDILLAVARYAINRLDISPQLLADISSMPFVHDGRPIPNWMRSLPENSIMYPSAERRANRKLGIVTLARAFAETVNVLNNSIKNRYSLRGINGKFGAYQQLDASVSTTPITTTTRAAGGVNTGTFSLNINFASAANLLSYLNGGSAIQLTASMTLPDTGVQPGDTNLKELFDARGIIRVTVDNTRIFSSGSVLSLAVEPTNVGTGRTVGTEVTLATQAVNGATYRLTARRTSDTQLRLSLSFASTGPMTGTVSVAWASIREATTYTKNGVTTNVYAPPLQFTNSDADVVFVNTLNIAQPTIISPANSAQNVSLTPTLTSSAFAVTGGTVSHSTSDWEVWTGINGTGTRVASALASTSRTSYTIPTNSLALNTTYYPRVRYNTSGGSSEWSVATSFKTTASIAAVATPTITSPSLNSNDVSRTPTVTASAFAVTGGTDTHASTDWEIWTGAGATGTKVWESLGNASAKTVITVPITLAASSKFYVRVRYNGTALGPSAWSTDIAFTTAPPAAITAPAITAPITGATNVSRAVSLSSTPFAVTHGTDTHASTDWQIWTGPNGTGTKAFESLASASNKTSITSTTLASGTQHYARVRYNGATLGASPWSADVSFTTTAGMINTPSITAPANNATGVSRTPNLTSSAFSANDADIQHTSTSWQIWTGPNGTGTKAFESVENATNKTSITVSPQLIADTKYYARVKYFGKEAFGGGSVNAAYTSGWSSDSTFTVAPALVSQTVNANANIALPVGVTQVTLTAAGANGYSQEEYDPGQEYIAPTPGNPGQPYKPPSYRWEVSNETSEQSSTGRPVQTPPTPTAAGQTWSGWIDSIYAPKQYLNTYGSYVSMQVEGTPGAFYWSTVGGHSGVEGGPRTLDTLPTPTAAGQTWSGWISSELFTEAGYTNYYTSYVSALDDPGQEYIAPTPGTPGQEYIAPSWYTVDYRGESTTVKVNGSTKTFLGGTGEGNSATPRTEIVILPSGTQHTLVITVGQPDGYLTFSYQMPAS